MLSTILFFILFFAVFGKLIEFAFKATWSIFKITMYLVFLPLILVGLVLGGLLYVALPILIVVGIFGIVARA